MLPTNWHKVLLLFLWITPHALLAVLTILLYQRRLYRQFSCFFAYVLCEIVGFIVLFTLYSVSGAGKLYSYAFCARLLLSIALRFGVIDEVAKDLFRGSQFLQRSARRSLQCVQCLLLMLGALLAVYAAGDHRSKLLAGMLVINRGAALVQCGLLLALLLYSRFLGLSWRLPTFGIALGLGTLTSVDLAVYALRAEFTSKAGTESLNLLVTGTYLICVLIWIGYSLAPEPELASVKVVSHDEVETWNTELQRLLGH